jgi:predicted nucleic acid-binding protein
MKAGEVYFLDTNILLEATDAKRAYHCEALDLFSKAHTQGAHLGVTGQVFREYHVVATRPVSGNGLGLKAELALENAASFLEWCVFFEETKAVYDELLGLIEANRITGKKAHDANIAAVMKAHRIENLITLNPKDFISFEGLNTYSPSEALLARD